MIVILTQAPYLDGTNEAPCFRAAGYLDSENPDDETGPTVTARWYGGDEESIDWDAPDSILHYRIGDITASATLAD